MVPPAAHHLRPPSFLASLSVCSAHQRTWDITGLRYRREEGGEERERDSGKRRKSGFYNPLTASAADTVLFASLRLFLFLLFFPTVSSSTSPLSSPPPWLCRSRCLSLVVSVWQKEMRGCSRRYCGWNSWLRACELGECAGWEPEPSLCMRLCAGFKCALLRNCVSVGVWERVLAHSVGDRGTMSQHSICL